MRTIVKALAGMLAGLALGAILAHAGTPMPALDSAGRPVMLVGHVVDAQVLARNEKCVVFGLLLDNETAAMVTHGVIKDEVGPAIALSIINDKGEILQEYGDDKTCHAGEPI